MPDNRRKYVIAFHSVVVSVLVSGALLLSGMAQTTLAADLKLKKLDTSPQKATTIKTLKPKEPKKATKVKKPEPKKATKVKLKDSNKPKLKQAPKPAIKKKPALKKIEPTKLKVAPAKKIDPARNANLGKALKKPTKVPQASAVRNLQTKKQLRLDAQPGIDPIKSQTGGGTVNTNVTDLKVDPSSSLSKDLSAPDVKDLAIVRPEIRENLNEDLKNQLSEDMNRDSVARGNLQGLAGDKGSSLGERTGIPLVSVGGNKNHLITGVDNAKSGQYVGPDPGGRRARVLDGLDYAYTSPDGKDFSLYVVSDSTAKAGNNDSDTILKNDGLDTDDYDAVVVIEDDNYDFIVNLNASDDPEESRAAVELLKQMVDDKHSSNNGDNDDGGLSPLGGNEENPKPSSCEEDGAACNEGDLGPGDNSTLRMANENNQGPLAKEPSQPGSGAIDTDPDRVTENIAENMDANKVEQRIQEGLGSGSIDPAQNQ